MALFFCPPFFCHFKCTTHISVDVNMPFNVNAFQSDQNVVDVLDSGCQNGNVDRAPANKASISKRTVGGFGPTFCSAILRSRGNQSLSFQVRFVHENADIAEDRV